MISSEVLMTTLQNITVTEILDIVFVATMIYVVFLFVKQTKSYFLAGIIFILTVVYALSQNLNLILTRSLIQPAYTFIVIIIAIVFQREIRRFFKWIVIGKLDMFTNTKYISKGSSAEIAEALLYMVNKKIGAILVFPSKQDIDDMVEGGQSLGGDITKEILLSVFDTSSPGHDGAVIIDGNYVKQFGVHLPLAREYADYRKAGTRHRAAAGITEDTDAIALVVSEERGVVSVCKQGKISVLKNEHELRDILKTLTGETEKKHAGVFRAVFLQHAETKIAAIVCSLILWVGFFAQVGTIKKEYDIPLSFQLLPANIEIDANSGKKLVKIVVEGKSSDINTLNPDKIEARIDARDFGTGTRNILIVPSMVNVPSFISISEIDPKTVKVDFREKGQ